MFYMYTYMYVHIIDVYIYLYISIYITLQRRKSHVPHLAIVAAFAELFEPPRCQTCVCRERVPFWKPIDPNPV
jgi:hypothetical protein